MNPISAILPAKEGCRILTESARRSAVCIRFAWFIGEFFVEVIPCVNTQLDEDRRRSFALALANHRGEARARKRAER
jgi:hypothetical protein